MRISHLPKALVLSALLLPAALPGVLTAAEAPSGALAIDAQSFRCIREMTPVRHFYVDNVLGNLPATLAAANAPGGAVYPPGSVIQLVPTEAMVKRLPEVQGQDQIQVGPELAKLLQATEKEALKRGDIRAMWIQTTNPWVTLPNRSRLPRPMSPATTRKRRRSHGTHGARVSSRRRAVGVPRWWRPMRMDGPRHWPASWSPKGCAV